MCDESTDTDELTTSFDIADFYKMKKPCANCPFLKEGAIELRPGRVEHILDGMMKDDHKPFLCHKTLDGFEREEGGYQAAGTEKMCAGASAVLWKRRMPTVGMRMALALRIAEPELWEQNFDKTID
ncbi:hypothetical protein IFT48_03635 [Pseudomonas fluorescens]|uniref:hypothetical protein n=1 Tax=Pseudomonas fluorescens TaxID=294 RepID=UPI001930D545|nr:hypothetical protein [Pseudomonas fluorescens]MBD8089061.1 hypothetical protein [Pseudomonas fluorescens]